jgi:hypothetical protein
LPNVHGFFHRRNSIGILEKRRGTRSGEDPNAQKEFFCIWKPVSKSRYACTTKYSKLGLKKKTKRKFTFSSTLSFLRKNDHGTKMKTMMTLKNDITRVTLLMGTIKFYADTKL